MQRQAVPLLRPERALVGTGLETQVARDSGMVPISRVNGTVTYVDANAIVVQDEDGNDLPPLSVKEKARRARMLFVDRVQVRVADPPPAESRLALRAVRCSAGMQIYMNCLGLT